MTFQAWKMKSLNFMTFQVFHDLYEPWIWKGLNASIIWKRYFCAVEDSTSFFFKLSHVSKLNRYTHAKGARQTCFVVS